MKFLNFLKRLYQDFISLFQLDPLLEPVEEKPVTRRHELTGIRVRMPHYLLWGYVYGGPYFKKPKDIHGVKMAEEINLPCDVSIPTADFSVPDINTMEKGLVKGLRLLSEHQELYVGCMGGIGRTGMYLAALRVLEGFGTGLGVERLVDDAIEDIRRVYHPSAVETKEQREFLKKLNYELILHSF